MRRSSSVAGKKPATVFVYIILGLALFLLATVFIPLPVKRVCLTTVRLPGGEKLYTATAPVLVLPRVATKSFIISYTHSVNKGRVQDFYTVKNDGNLVLLKTRFKSYGAGMPEPDDCPGQVFFQGDDYLEMQNINRVVPVLTMAVGMIANHAIEIENGYYSLSDFFQKQTRIQIQYRRVTAKELLTEYINNGKKNKINANGD